MTLKDQIAADVAIFFNTDEFAEQVTYNGVSILVVPEIGETNQRGNGIVSDGRSDKAYFWVEVSEVPNPVAGDTISHLSKTWSVVRVAEGDGGMYKLECVANESPWSR